MRNATVTLVQADGYARALATLKNYDHITHGDIDGRLSVTASRSTGGTRVLTFAPGHWSWVDIEEHDEVVAVPVDAARDAVVALSVLAAGDVLPERDRAAYRAAMEAFAAAGITLAPVAADTAEAAELLPGDIIPAAAVGVVKHPAECPCIA